nr:MAG TPA: Ion transport protein N-terminal [Bacteriophage sp.]
MTQNIHALIGHPLPDLFTDADKKVYPFVIHPLSFISYVAEVQTCRCDTLSRVL